VKKQRIVGYDVARAIAMFGMIVHHFVIAAAADHESSYWLTMVLTSLADGRPAAMFLILAGIGITLRSRRSVESGDRVLIKHERAILAKRGFLLLALGFLNLLVWPGDILRVYGVSLLLASQLLDASNRRLVCFSACFAVGFVVLLFVLDYERNWDWSTMTYHNLWTKEGIVRNLFFDGFRAVFPWSGFLFFGMWLGRHEMRDHATLMKCVVRGFAIMVIAETVSAFSVWILLSEPNHDPSRHEEVIALFGTRSMPPLPLFLAAAGGLAVTIIGICIYVAELFPRSIVVRSLSMTGQMALTWYFAHIYFGLGALVWFDAIGNQTIGFAIATGSGFFFIAMIASFYLRGRYQYGPLEWIFRALTSNSAV